MKKNLLFVVLAPMAIIAMLIQALRLRDFSPPDYEMWE